MSSPKSYYKMSHETRAALLVLIERMRPTGSGPVAIAYAANKAGLRTNGETRITPASVSACIGKLAEYKARGYAPAPLNVTPTTRVKLATTPAQDAFAASVFANEQLTASQKLAVLQAYFTAGGVT